jgi:hypothetical protein
MRRIRRKNYYCARGCTLLETTYLEKRAAPYSTLKTRISKTSLSFASDEKLHVQPFAIGNHLAFELSKVTLETGETSTARAKYCFIALDQELLFAHLRTRLLMFENSSF